MTKDSGPISTPGFCDVSTPGIGETQTHGIGEVPLPGHSASSHGQTQTPGAVSRREKLDRRS